MPFRVFGHGLWFRKLVPFIMVIVFLKVLIVSYRSETNYFSDCMLETLEGPFKYDDPQLIRHIRESVLEPPSTLPYQLDVRSGRRFHDSEKFYDIFIEKLFRNKKNGFFVEAGALDGQAMSNTLALEMKQGWTGLLVEPDPSSYISMKKKHRKAWTAKTCLSVTGYPKVERLSSINVKHKNNESPQYARATGTIVRKGNNTYIRRQYETREIAHTFYTRQCFPLDSLLLAMNVSRVDLLSLDVESFEKEIIENFNFERFDIQVIFMEWWNFKKLVWLNEFMAKKGFHFVKNILADIIYVKKYSDIYRLVLEQNLQGKFVMFEISNNTKQQ